MSSPLLDGDTAVSNSPVPPAATAADSSVAAPSARRARRDRAIKALARDSMIAGILAFLLGWSPWLGGFLGAGAIILGVMALVRRQRKAFAITGIVLGSIGFVTAIAIAIATPWIVANLEKFAAQAESAAEAPLVETPPAAALGASGETVCPEFDDLATEQHVKVWATIDGLYSVEYEDGPVGMPGLVIHQVEVLPAF